MENLDFDINSYSINEIHTILGTSSKMELVEIKKKVEFKKKQAEQLDDLHKYSFIKLIEDCYRIVSSLKKEPDEEKLIRKPPDNVQVTNNRNLCNYNLNPITPSTIKQIITINSLFRDNPTNSTSSNFVFTLPNEITNVISMKLTSTEIPNTNYIVEEGKNIFSITIKDNSSATETKYDITIPEGTWSASDLITFLQTFFDTDNTTDLRYLLLALNSQTGRLIIRFKTDVEIANLNTLYTYILTPPHRNNLEYKLSNREVESKYLCDDDYALDNNILYVMGFNLDQLDLYYSASTITNYGREEFRGYVTANFIYAHTLDTYYYVSINEFITNSKDQLMAFKKDGMIAQNILGKVQIKNNPFTTNIDNNADNVFKERNYFGNVKIRKLEIKVLNKHGNVINFNNSEISLSLELTQSYCSENQNNFSKSLFLQGNI